MAKPYESDHAILRRFLIANYGIPYSTLETILREKIQEKSGIIGRILELHPSSHKSSTNNIYSHNHIHRQCPQCARNLYHTDIYHFAWLKRCPIHHCLFATKCPDCKQPWPNKVELATRDCPSCGCTVLKKLNNEFNLEKTDGTYQPVADIYNFIKYRDDNDVSLTVPHVWIGNWKWWDNITISDALFPSYQVRRHPEFTIKKLKSLHIEILPVHQKTTELVFLGRGQPNDRYAPRRNLFCLDLKNASQSALRSDFHVMKRILSWIRKQTNKNHQIHISSYRHLALKDLLKGPLPCQFCMALSLWFFYYASIKYGKNYIIDTNDYPFCRECGYINFYDVSENNTINYQWKSHYKIEGAFSIWHYRRGLEVSFIDIFRFTQHLFRERSHCNKLYFSIRKFTDQSCMIDIKHNKLHYYYEHEYLLNELRISRVTKNDYHCNNHRQYLNEEIRTILPFDINVRSRNFTYNDFMILHKKFREFIH